MNRVPLQDICSEVVDCINKTAPTVDYLTPYKMLRTPNVRSGKIILEGMKCVDEETFNKWNRRVTPQKGDIILTREAPLGEIGMLPDVKNVFLGQRLMLYRVNCELANPYYVLYGFLCSDLQSQIHSQGSGSTVTHLRVPDAENLTILLPEREIQDKVAYILTRYDDLIENNNRRIAILEEMAQKLYREWFVHFRFPGHENVKMVESEIGLIPEGWKISPVSEIASLLSGFAFKSRAFSSNGRYNIITIKNVKNSGFDLSNTNFIDEIPQNMPNHCKIINGDILMSLTGNVGRVCIAYGNNLLLNQRVAKISSEYSCFSYCLFKSDDIFAKLNILANGVAQQNLSPIEAMKIKVCIPEKHKLIQFEKAVGRMLEEIKNLYCKNANLRKTRDLLLPRLISGDIDVSELDIPIKEG